MVLARSSTAKARLRWRGSLVSVSVDDDGRWDVPAEHPDLAEYLSEFYGSTLGFRGAWRVEGEPAHDLLQHVVDKMGAGEMLTRKLPIPAAEPGVVY